MSKFLSGRVNKILVGILGYTENKTVVQTTGKVGIGTTNAQQNSLYVVGDTNITGDTNVGGALTASQATVSDLTDNRIVVAGTAGRLEDSAGLTFDGSTLTVDGDLQVAGVLSYDDVTNVDSLGIVTARKGLHVLSDGIDIAGVSTFQNDVHLGDSDILYFGDDNDLKIFHSGSASNIQQVGTGPLQIRNEVADQDVVIQADNGSGSTTQYFRADGSDGGAKLYNYGSLKLETTGIGVSIYNDLNVGTAVTVYGNAGIVSAISFYGDGANLTNTGATLNAVSGTERLVTTQLTSGTMVDAATDADLTFRASDNLLSTPNIAISGGISTDGYDTGNQFELMRADGNGGWAWASVPGIFSVNNILNGFNVREEGLIVGTAGSIHTLDFHGLNVTASANPQPNGIATITMSPTPTFDELYVVGVTSTNNLRVTGVSTFSSDVNLNGDINLNGNITSNVTIVSTAAGSSAAPELKLYRNHASPQDADYLGQIKFAGESDTGVERNYAKITGKILDASNGTEDGILEFAHIKNGSQNISARFRSDSLQLLNGTNFSVAGDSTFTGDITANSNIDANGDVDIAGTLDVDGHTLLDNVSISGVTTTSGLLDINAGGQANTFKVEDLTSGRVVLAGTGGELEDSGNLTFDGSTLSVTGDLSVSGTLSYDDVTNIDAVGIVTARNGLHVLSNGVNIAGLSTFTGRIVGAATSNVIPFLYANLSDLPSASTYHGAFAHVHATGRAYYAHAANWYELVNKELNGDLIVGTGITMYANTGIVSATAFYGDGSNLLNTGATLNAATGTQRLVLTGLTSGTMVDAATDSDLAYNASDDRLIVANLDISGITTLGGPVTAGSSEGAVGQYLRHVGTGVTWANFPTLRTTQTNTATAGQTTFNFTYNTNFLDVFVNGVKLSPSEYTATNGSQIILNTAAFADEIVEFHSYNTASTYGGGGGSSYTNSDVDNHINISSASSGEVLGWNGSDYDWVAQTAAYTNSDVDSHLNVSGASSGQILSWNGSDYAWVADQTGGSGITTAIINADTIDSGSLNVSGVSTFQDDVTFTSATTGLGVFYDRSADTLKLLEDGSDNTKLTLGNNSTYSSYMQIYHDGGNSGIGYINYAGSNKMVLSGNNISFFNTTRSEVMLSAVENNGVFLYYDNVQKFQTTASGIQVTGTVAATAVTGDGSGLTGLTGASAATYGNGTAVPQITVDANGRITGITNVSISGGGGGGGTSMFIRDSGSLVGAAGTIDFGAGLSVSPVSAGIVTVTSGISTAIINADTIDSGSVNVSGISTVTGTTFTNQLSVSGVSTFQGNATFQSNVRLGDGDKLILGSDLVTNDLEIYHGGSLDNHGYVTSNTGNLYLTSGVSGAVHLKAYNVSNLIVQQTSVQLKHSNNLKLETSNTGVTITGTASATTFSGSGASLTTLNASELDSGTIPDARFPSTLPAVSGANLTNLPAPTPADTDVQVTFDISSNGSSAYRFTGPGNSGSDDNPDLYLVRGQRYRFINGTGSSHPFEIRVSNGGSAYTDGITGSTSGTQDFNVQHDAPAKLFYQCTIHSGMVGTIYIVGGDQFIPDGEKLSLGTDADLEIEHNGSTSFIRTSATSTGDLAIEARGTNHDLYLTAADDIYIRPQGGEDGIKVHGDGSVELYHDASKKFETVSNGVLASGRIFVQSTSGGLDYNSVQHTLEYIVNGSTHSELNTGSYVPQGTKNLGSNAARWQTLFVSNGIDFGSTSDASGMSSEVLDDYEEGSWTPDLRFNNAASGVTYSRQEGHYTKIGRQVFAQFRITLTSKGTSTGSLTIRGLPFTAANIFTSTGIDGQVHLGHDDGFNAGQVSNSPVSGYVEGGTDYFFLTRRDSNASLNTMQYGYVDNDLSISGTVIYYA